MYFVRTYHGTTNLGDAIQTYALCRLLPECAAWRDGCGPLILNGYCGKLPVPFAPQTIAAGVYVSPQTPEHLDSLAGCGIVGARDPAMAGRLTRHGITARLTGCATLTLPRYTGPRPGGELRIDDGQPGAIQPYVAPETPWRGQWKQAVALLLRMRFASLVYTRRLHVVLPCLAMGTPVVWRRGGDEADERFSLLDAMGVPESEKVTVSPKRVGEWREAFIGFLQERGVRVVDREPRCPE